jgi:hypothetical protein
MSFTWMSIPRPGASHRPGNRRRGREAIADRGDQFTPAAQSIVRFGLTTAG